MHCAESPNQRRMDMLMSSYAVLLQAGHTRAEQERRGIRPSAPQAEPEVRRFVDLQWRFSIQPYSSKAALQIARSFCPYVNPQYLKFPFVPAPFCIPSNLLPICMLLTLCGIPTHFLGFLSTPLPLCSVIVTSRVGRASSLDLISVLWSILFAASRRVTTIW